MRLHFSFFLVIALLAFSSISSAQSKIDLQLLKTLRKSEATVPVPVRGANVRNVEMLTVMAVLHEGAQLPVAELKEMGVRVGSQVGRVVSLRTPIDRLETLAELPCIESVNANRRHEVNCMITRKETGVDILHGGQSSKGESVPLPYTGKGVLLGIVDTGIEYNHLNFRDPETGKSRVNTAVLYRPLEGEADAVREVYVDPSQIDTLTTDYVLKGHGTQTTGVAAGSYPGLQQYGMAPEADLILCGTSVLEDDRLIDALQIIFARAEELGRPCVVNLSIGNSVDWKDGKTPLCLACDALTEGGNAAGRAIVFSAGNYGDKRFSAEYQFCDTMPVYTLLEPYRTDNHSWYYDPNVVVYSSDSLPIQLDFLLFDTLRCEFRELPFEQHRLDTLEAGHDNRRLVDIDCDTCDMKGFEHCLLSAKLSGTPGTSVAIYYVNKWSVDYAMMAGRNEERWLSGTADLSISDLCCLDAVISVGSYCDRDSLFNVFNRTVWPTDSRNEINKFSSYGRTWQGTPKPDVVAPGDLLVSSYSSFHEARIIYYYTSGRYLDSPMMYVVTPDAEGPTYYWTSDRGTSLSSPCVAGIIALWMEACPTLSVRQIREILHETSRFDDYCQESFGNGMQAGFGKIDAVAGMQKVLEMSAIQDVRPEPVLTHGCYDLFGRSIRSQNSHRGISIKDGKAIMSWGSFR